MRSFTAREKSIIAGMFISKYDKEGLEKLGFSSFKEAFTVIGLALNIKPASVKNYRDEFDIIFDNKRVGWHRRGIRQYCKELHAEFGSLDFDSFAEFVNSLIYTDYDILKLKEISEVYSERESTTFAKRLITGVAAEKYFMDIYQTIPIFENLDIQDTTRMGCGFDFKLFSHNQMYGVEVKGLAEKSGNVSMTEKEYRVAQLMKDRYFMFVVKNFRHKPFHEIYQDPLNKNLDIKMIERQTVQVIWSFKM